MNKNIYYERDCDLDAFAFYLSESDKKDGRLYISADQILEVAEKVKKLREKPSVPSEQRKD